VRTLLALVAIAAACKSKAPDERAGSAAPSVKPPPAADAAAQPARAQPTPAQVAEVHKHMKAAWAAQRAKRWADAVTELEAAQKIFDGDARVLSELGWSEMWAGDLAKARKLDEAAIRAAVDPKLKASGLFNLGLVQEKLNDTDGARASFTESIRLRPNATVQSELAKLGTALPPPPFCAAGKKPCDCIIAAVGDDAECEPTTEPKQPIASFHLFEVKGNDSATYLLDEHDQLVAIVAGGAEHMRRYGHTSLDSSKVESIGGHKVLWLETTVDETTDSIGEKESESENVVTHLATVCAVGDAKTPTKCASVPRSLTNIIDRTVIKDDGSFGAMSQDRSETKLDVALGTDGVVTVKLAKGSTEPLDPSVLGPHPLW
jgi:Flp pilus assembly protein TadD